ncbi:8851_t:CDS:2 [Entrophospora sp. SA101]|nr:8851_t:CDS:2 [Entrophospora sp. SA101]
MAPIHTLNSGSTVAENFQGRGYKLDSTRERELESERNELLIKTEFFANKCSDFRNAKVLAETRSDELAKELKSKNEKILHDQTLIKAGFWVEESSHRPELVSRHIVPLNRYRKSDTQRHQKSDTQRLAKK